MVGSKSLQTKTTNNPNGSSTINTRSNMNIGLHPHIADPDNYNLYEIQRSNNFEFVVTGLGQLWKAGYLGVEADPTINNAEEVIRLSVAQCPIPHFSQGVITIQRGNNSLKYAGVPSFSNGQIVLHDFIGLSTKEVLMAWQNLSYNQQTEKVGWASDYKKEASLIEYSPDYQIVRKWKIHGCWIRGISEDNYNSEGNDKHSITITIEYDSAQIDTDDIE